MVDDVFRIEILPHIPPEGLFAIPRGYRVIEKKPDVQEILGVMEGAR